jgi:hypothetical protein
MAKYISLCTFFGKRDRSLFFEAAKPTKEPSQKIFVDKKRIHRFPKNFAIFLVVFRMRLLTTRRLLYQCRRFKSMEQAKTVDTNLKPVIGLEIHAQLLTRSKMFSDAPVESQAPSNLNVSLFDLGIPGTLPTLNRKCVEVRHCKLLQS